MKPRRPKKATGSMAEDVRRVMDADAEHDGSDGVKGPHTRALRHQIGLGGKLGSVPVDYRRLRHLPLHKPLPSFTGDVPRYLDDVEAWMPHRSLSDLRAPPADYEDTQRMENMQALGKLPDGGPPIAGDVLMVTTVQGFVGRARKHLADGEPDNALAYCMLIAETLADLDYLLAQARRSVGAEDRAAKKRRENKDRDDEIVKLHRAGYSNAEIEAFLQDRGQKVGRSTISGVIRERKK